MQTVTTIADLHPDPKNARKRTQRSGGMIVKSLQECGASRSIVIDERGMILAGHGTVEAAGEAGIDKVHVVDVDGETLVAVRRSGLTEKQKIRLALLDNRTSELAEWDTEILAELNDELDLKDLWNEDELNALFADAGGPNELLTDPDEIPENVETRCKYGDFWRLGEHRILCGDSTKAEDVGRLMDGAKAQLMTTDPPYGDSWVQKAKDMQSHGYVHSRAGLHGSIDSDDLDEVALREFIISFLTIAREVASAPPFPSYVWHRAKRRLFEQAFIDAGFFMHQPVTWIKPSFVIGRMHYHPRCEWALHGWLQGNGKCPFYGERNQSDVWELGRENDGIHPTQKPCELFNIPIRNHTKNGELVYDPFLGSGTTLIAANQLGRKCYGLEIEPKYCDVIIQRFMNATGKEAELISKA